MLLDALRYAALQPTKGFGAVIFRRTSPQITQQGGLWDEASGIYPLAGGKSNKTYLAWEWPQHGTRIRFAHMQHDTDRFNWQGSQLAYLAYDELTHFTQEQFWYLLSRNRSTCGVKPRVRATTNPDADSWVKTFLAPWVDDTYPFPALGGEVRYFSREDDTIHWYRPEDTPPDHAKSCTFIPAKLSDNPALLQRDPSYLANLMALPHVERQRLLYGDWAVRPSGALFKRHWFEIVDAAPTLDRSVRYWDMAATEAATGRDPDWTAGVLMGRVGADYYILDVAHERLTPKGNEDLLLHTAQRDGVRVKVCQEQEPGASGKAMVDRYRTLLAGYDVHAVRATGDKITRARPFSAQAEAGHVKLVRGSWNDAFLNELCAFPQVGVHDDQVDGASGAFGQLVRGNVYEEIMQRAEMRQELLAHQGIVTQGLAHPGNTPETALVAPTPPDDPDPLPATPTLPNTFAWPF